MAGWSKIVDGSALDCFKTLQTTLQANEFCFDLELGYEGGCLEGDKEDKLRRFFDKFLLVFLKEICGSDLYRPLPPMLGNGQSVDLFKLFLVVREKGGYETVSKYEMWDSVAEESGLGFGFSSAVKLIYVKYLDTLGRWLQRIVKDKEAKGGLVDNSGSDLGGFVMELESEFKGFLLEVQKKRDIECPVLDLEKIELNFKNVGSFCKVGDVQSVVDSDGVEKNVDDTKNGGNSEDSKNVDLGVVNKKVSDRKRKRECHSGMLDWVMKVAKNPCDPEIGSLPEWPKWKNYGSEQFWKQVLFAREAMFLKRNVDLRAEQSVWQKQRMHPFMYEDDTGSDRLRCSKRLLSVKESRALISSKKSRTRACSESSSGTQSDLEDHLDKNSGPYTANSLVGLWIDNHNRKRLPVGPFFQAEVPEWTGDPYESDSKWLGTQTWPLKDGESKRILIERERMGKGRQDSCGCQFPGSVSCVRFHVAEKRMRVKLEVGSAFYNWAFDKMGEEVALSWTKEDEKKFEATVKLNPPSLDKCFWDEIYKAFPSKSRKVLVSYYFNVFLLQRRGYQNRSTPGNIDSDDEDSAQGSTNELVKSPGSILGTPKKVHLNFR